MRALCAFRAEQSDQIIHLTYVDIPEIKKKKINKFYFVSIRKKKILFGRLFWERERGREGENMEKIKFKTTRNCKEGNR